MNKERFEYVENDGVNYIDDNKTGITYIATNYYDMKDMTKLLNQQDQRIAELEEQLKNAIVPKFKIGQNVWCVYPTNKYRQGFVFELELVGYTKDKIICRITENEEFEYDEVFSTKEEAQSKLEELKGE